MEDFLSRERAALEALESVDIGPADAMQIDEPASAGTSTPRASVSSMASPSFVPDTQSPIVSSPHAPAHTHASSPTTNPSQPHQSSSVFASLPSNGLGSPSTPRGRPETAAIKSWKSEQTRRIAERDAAAEQLRQKRRERAKQELEQYRAGWREEVEVRKRANRESEGRMEERTGKSEWDDEKVMERGEAVEWEEVRRLIEVLPRPAKDCSRLHAILKSL